MRTIKLRIVLSSIRLSLIQRQRKRGQERLKEGLRKKGNKSMRREREVAGEKSSGAFLHLSYSCLDATSG